MHKLNSDCLPPIFSYLTLSDLFKLRQVSRWLKHEVERHLLTVCSLPLFLTTPRTAKEIRKYEDLFMPVEFRANNYDNYVNYWDFSHKRIRFSYYKNAWQCIRRQWFGTSGLVTFEDGTILDNQRHFRFDDFIVLHNSLTLSQFLRLVQKLCPKIQKLAIVIDDCDHYLPEVFKIIDALPAIKVLLVESTLQDSCRHCLDRTDGDDMSEFLLRSKRRPNLRLPETVYSSILKLESLEELFFFPKRQSKLKIEGEPGSCERNFIGLLVKKLKVLHFNTRCYVLESFHELNNRWNIREQNLLFDGSLEELGYGEDEWLNRSNQLVLPNLKRMLYFNIKGHSLEKVVLESFPRPELKVLDICYNFILEADDMERLNSFTGLESFHCHDIIVTDTRLTDYYTLFTKRPISDQLVPDDLKNRTIKHLRLIHSSSQFIENMIQAVRQWNKHFVALETVVFVEPDYLEIRVSDGAYRKCPLFGEFILFSPKVSSWD